MNLSCQDWEMEENIRYKLNEVTDVSISLNMPRSHLRWALNYPSSNTKLPNILTNTNETYFITARRIGVKKNAYITE
jgi:hypothetical protein